MKTMTLEERFYSLGRTKLTLFSREVDETLGEMAEMGDLMRDLLEEHLAEARVLAGRAANVISSPREAESMLRLQGWIAGLESLLDRPVFGLADRIERAQEKLDQDARVEQPV